MLKFLQYVLVCVLKVTSVCIGLCVEGYFSVYWFVCGRLLQYVLVCVLKATSVCIGLCVEGHFSMYWFVC